MTSFRQIILNIFRPRATLMWLLLLIILLCIGGYYVFQNTKSQIKENDIDDIPNSTAVKKEMVIYFFFADWCPHCTKAKKPWNEFYSTYHNKAVNNCKIICKPQDCSDLGPENNNKNAEAKRLVNKFDVQGYPTIKVQKDGVLIDFDAKITKNSLTQFLETTTK